MTKLSIIIPIYNTGKYLAQCLESLQVQLHPEIEILLIDDCSTDNSAEICMDYCKRSENFRYFIQDCNRGVAEARNRGLDEAVGEYILFIDSDDFVASDYMERIFSYTESGYDLVSFGCFNYVHNGDEKYHTAESSMNISANSRYELQKAWETLLINSFFMSPWNKLFRSSIIEQNKIRFIAGCVCYEDYMFNLEYCGKIKDFLAVPEAVYYYRQDASKRGCQKRKWGELFTLSDLTAGQTEKFIEENAEKGMDVSVIRRYCYTAYMTELQYVYFCQPHRFSDAVKMLAGKTAFRRSLDAFRPAGKSILLLKTAIDWHLIWLQKVILNKLSKRG